MSVDQARVLIVDDDEDDAVLARSLLRESEQPTYESVWAPTYEEGIARLTSERFDACLVDYRLGARDGIQFIEEAASRAALVPFILLTGEGSREVDLAAMRAGASDFLQKAQLTASLLDRAIRYAVQQKRVEDQRFEIVVAQTARRTAERASAAKDTFIALLAHELRNPLAGLSNAVALVAAPNATPESITFAREVLQRQTATMRRLINDLLDVARLTHGKLQLDREPVDVVEIARRAVVGATVDAARKQQEIRTDLPDGLITVDGDAVRLEQALGNLLDNAVRFTPEHGHITLSVAAAGRAVVLVVRDDGAGMSPAILEQAFELFVQERPTGGEPGGLGVGLGVVRGIIEGHGGHVAAASDGPGLGATFTVTLPRADVALAGESLSVGPRVLIVDDNADTSDLLAQYLRARGATVVIAGDGASAIRAFERHQPRAVCLDLGLPDMDGVEVARRLRAAAERPFALAVVSGFSRASDRARASSAGVDRYFVKPADLDDLSRFLTGVTE